MWRTDTDGGTFRKTKLWSIINQMDLFVIERIVDGVSICCPGFVTIDHQMDFHSWVREESKNIISGSISTSAEGLSAAQKFVILSICKGQEKAEQTFVQPVSCTALSGS